MGRYTSLEAVRQRLIGKVRFTENDADENKLSHKLANRLILEAEGQVELHLSPRYMAPFQGDNGEVFSQLPSAPTQDVLRALCELQSCIRILEQDFGSGTIVDAEKYIKRLEKRYDSIREDLLKKKEYQGDAQGWMYPPLPGLKLNYMNTEADDGYHGQIFNTSDLGGQSDYPRKQINSPSENFFSGCLDE